jgi:hypothetical protein
VTRFDTDQIVQDAIGVDGLSDFGDESDHEPMEKKLWSCEPEARLNETGAAVMRQRVDEMESLRSGLKVTLPDLLESVEIEPESSLRLNAPRSPASANQRIRERTRFKMLWYPPGGGLKSGMRAIAFF